MKKPIIGVIPLYDEEKESIWMLPGYLEGLSEAGAIPVVLPMHLEAGELDELDGMLDGYLFTGGHDVDPRLYDQERLSLCGPSCKMRDRLETMIFEKAGQENKPVLGICRGLQLLNVLYGGTLYQDLPEEYPQKSEIDHHMTAPYDRTVHGVTIEPESPLRQLLGKTKLQVNSYHHQGICALGTGLKVMAVSDDGLVEGIYDPEKKFVWGVQWHPEFIYQKDEDARRIFLAFVEACA